MYRFATKNVSLIEVIDLHMIYNTYGFCISAIAFCEEHSFFVFLVLKILGWRHIMILKTLTYWFTDFCHIQKWSILRNKLSQLLVDLLFFYMYILQTLSLSLGSFHHHGKANLRWHKEKMFKLQVCFALPFSALKQTRTPTSWPNTQEDIR